MTASSARPRERQPTRDLHAHVGLGIGRALHERRPRASEAAVREAPHGDGRRGAVAADASRAKAYADAARTPASLELRFASNARRNTSAPGTSTRRVPPPRAPAFRDRRASRVPWAPRPHRAAGRALRPRRRAPSRGVGGQLHERLPRRQVGDEPDRVRGVRADLRVASLVAFSRSRSDEGSAICPNRRRGPGCG